MAEIYIDNDAWDFFFDRRLDLAVELPREEFRIHITREAEFEIPPTPVEVRTFIEATIAKCQIETHSFLGFGDTNLSKDEQRVGGLGVGRWASGEQVDFIRSQKSRMGGMRKTKLYKNEADISIAARSFHAIVLSLNKSRGPLKTARKRGGNVVFLNDFDKSGLTLSDFIKSKIQP